MALDFRMHIRVEQDSTVVANLITATGDVRDAFGNRRALDMLDSLVEEIRFCKRYILDDSAYAKGMRRADAKREKVHATGTPFHPNA